MIQCEACRADFVEGRKPMALPCGHSLCNECTQKATACSSCAAVYDPRNVPVNHLAQDLLVKFAAVSIGEAVQDLLNPDYDDKFDGNDADTLSKGPLCDNCREIPLKIQCERCDLFLCADCDVVIHSIAVFRAHERDEVNGYLSALSDTRCSEHIGQKLAFYCKEDSELICSDCCHQLLGGSHVGHSCVSIEEAAHEAESHLNALLVEMDETVNQYSKLLTTWTSDVATHVQDMHICYAKFCQEIASQWKYTKQLIKDTNHINVRIKNLTFDEIKEPVQRIRLRSKATTLRDEVLGKIRRLPTTSKKLNDSSDVLLEKLDALTQLSYLPEYLTPALISASKHAFPDSLIISADQAYTLMKWYGDIESHWKLLFRASRDGYEATDFHRLCDRKSDTIVIVKSGSFIFGGYTPLAWNSRDGPITGGSCESWVFSLENPSKRPTHFPSTSATNEIRGYRTYGPIFGCEWWHLGDGADCKRGRIMNCVHYDVSSISGWNEAFLGVQGWFDVADYEVYQCIS